MNLASLATSYSKRNRYFVVSILLLFSSFTALADDKELSVKSVLNQSELKPGFLSVWYQRDTSKTYLVVNKDLGEFIYQTSLPHGLGSNDIGLDRGQLSQTRLVSFQEDGKYLSLIQKNTQYIARSDNAAEKKAMEDSFANAILWRFDIVASDDESWLIEANDFLVQDTHDVVDRLQSRKQGSFKFDKSRSLIASENYKSFPHNTELEAKLTFTSSKPGEFVRQVAIDPKNVSLKVRHSFVKLPEPGYEPLKYHPNSGYFAHSFQDYAQPIHAKITQQLIPRHRLKKQNPNAKTSKAVNPIVYYVDAGAPEPVMSALLEGARWWNQAFEAIGYEDAFQVYPLPADADPMDVRYNIIQWVHRATRGWSYGFSVIDPRTGEIIKGHVSLGSLRIRQDYLIAQAMLAPFAGDETADEQLQTLALNRIKQLSAHEVGHTLGIAHNFAASAYDRGSVMDYPHPLFGLAKGRITTDNAYTLEIGAWDKQVVAYGYSDFPDETAEKQRQAILDYNRKNKMWFISDADSRDISDAHPTANLWDNGADAVEELARVMELRKTALGRFGEANLRTKRPYSDLEETLVPLYYFHRFQAIAAGKSIGGYNYNYDIKGENDLLNEPVSHKQQLKAFVVLMETLAPEFLNIPDNVAQLIAPKVHSSYRTRESINGDMGVVFDRFKLAAGSVQHTFNILLNNQRLMRLIQQRNQNSKLYSPEKIINTLHQLLLTNGFDGMERELHSQSLSLLHSNLLNKLHAASTPERLKRTYFSVIQAAANRIKGKLESGAAESEELEDSLRYELFRLENGLKAKDWKALALPKMPPGSPI